MVLWRISRHKNLTGAGGLKASGRWHYAGYPIVYMSESPAAALLEVCVHTSANDVPPDFLLLKVTGPELEVPEATSDQLSAGWQRDWNATRDLGMRWLRQKDSVLLRVPCAIVPQTNNVLFNPAHNQARLFRIVETIFYPFDSRIKK